MNNFGQNLVERKWYTWILDTLGSEAGEFFFILYLFDIQRHSALMCSISLFMPNNQSED